MDLSVVRTKLMGFGMQVLDGIDPNPDNFVLAGIIHTRMAQIGCLLRLEPNKAAQVNKTRNDCFGYLVRTDNFKFGLQLLFFATILTQRQFFLSLIDSDSKGWECHFTVSFKQLRQLTRFLFVDFRCFG